MKNEISKVKVNIKQENELEVEVKDTIDLCKSGR